MPFAGYFRAHGSRGRRCGVVCSPKSSCSSWPPLRRPVICRKQRQDPTRLRTMTKVYYSVFGKNELAVPG